MSDFVRHHLQLFPWPRRSDFQPRAVACAIIPRISRAVGRALGGPRFVPSGFALTWDTTAVPPGAHTLYVQVRTSCGWTANTRNVTVVTRPGGAGSALTRPAAAPNPAAPPGAGTVSVPGATGP